MKTVIYHSADFDGIFCREIARKFLGPQNPNDESVLFIGWNFGDAKVEMPNTGQVYIVDLSPDCLQVPFTVPAPIRGRLIWIDHHKTSIEKWPGDIPGYRIDGVAACRLAWQWFSTGRREREDMGQMLPLPPKQTFIDRKVSEPMAVRLAGEYDIWDRRDPNAEVFQYTLRVIDDDSFQGLLGDNSEYWVEKLLPQGEIAKRYADKINADIANYLTWIMEWEGMKWLCVNHARFNSLLFAARDNPETGHDALLGFRFDGKSWMVSLYHAAHRKDLDLSEIAQKYGGGGHRGACGFTCKQLPFTL